MFASAIPTRRNYPNVEVEPFVGFNTESESLPWLSNEVTDEQEAEWGGRWQAPRRSMQSRLRPVPRTPQRQPARPWQRRTRQVNAVFGAQPLRAARSSKFVRWVQNALNQSMNLRLRVNGVMGKETRSALRSFQRQRGLPASGILGPDTLAALRSVFGGQSARMDGAGETAEEVEIGPLKASLAWQTSSDNPGSFLFKREEAVKKDKGVGKYGGGVYIVVDVKDPKKILKVGKAMSFASRLGSYRNGLVRLHPPNKGAKVDADDLRFYLGRIDNAVDPFTHVERALTRLLFRIGEDLPGSRSVEAQPVVDKVELKNILPPPFKSKLLPAYRAKQGKDVHGHQIEQGKAPYQVHADDLILEPGGFTKWEVF